MITSFRHVALFTYAAISSAPAMARKVCKKSKCYFLLLCLVPLTVLGQEEIPVSYNIPAVCGSTSLRASNAIKRKRAPRQRNGVIMTNKDDSNLSDIKCCIELACEIWEKILDRNDTVWINFEYGPNVGNDIVVETDYRVANDGIPRMAALHFCKIMNGVHEKKPNAVIRVNSTVNWGTGFSSDSSDEKNLTLTLSRAIGRVLGFGASLAYGPRRLEYLCNRTASVFDRQIINSSGTLMPESSATGLADRFFKDNYNNAYVCSIDDAHKLYSPEKFSKDSTFAFLQNGNTLMSISMPNSIDMRMDDVVAGIMQNIGWTKDGSSERLIVADDIDSTGVCSAYEQHRFHLSAQCVTPTWRFILPLNDGTETIVASATGQSFCIPSITDENIYKRTVEGDILGRIELECVKNGSAYSEEYIITLELKPRILDVRILDVEILPNSYANYTVGVSYQGCYTLECLVEEEYASGATQIISNAPFYTKLRIPNVDIYGQAWLHLYARNSYGGDFKEVELPTDENIIYSSERPLQSGFNNIFAENILDYNISDMSSRLIKSESEMRGKAGEIHILKYLDEKGNIIGIRKVLVK